jgi:hypothetical protein
MSLADGLIGGKKSITSSNTAEALTTTSTVTSSGVIVKASAANTHVLYVGSSSVNNEWLELEKKEWVAVDIADPSKIYVYGTSGDSVRWLAATP